MAGTWEKQRILLRELLRATRDRHGLTQAELAHCLGKPQSYVSKVESGERRVDVVEVREICRCCGGDFQLFMQQFESAVSQL